MAFRASQLLLWRPSRHGAPLVGLVSVRRRARLALVYGLLSCADLTRPPAHRLLSSSAIAALQPTAVSPAASAAAARILPEEPPVVAAPPPGAPAPSAEPSADPRSPRAPTVVPAKASSGDQIGAAHILVAYQGATRAKPTVTRTKEEARKLAESLAERARQPGTDFARLARETSDGPTGIEGGALPSFGRQQMVKPFSDAAFALQPGQISDVVETNFGFHIIKRTE